ncbi:MAG: DUF2244 domain-containing protein [Rhodovarius sp.]|nr:DUF2244 domain-containing protein [Rhodovarius sp.]
MADSPPAPTFEALMRPRQALDRRGLRVVAAVLGAGFGTSALLFTVLGAWPVLGFVGLEALLVAGLFTLYRRAGARAFERIRLEGGQILVEQADHRGRLRRLLLDAYWARVRIEEGPQPRLFLASRGEEAEIGLFLGEEERRALAEALQEALYRARHPLFDNPVLR